MKKNTGSNYIEINKHCWNNLTDIHLNSKFYNHQSFLNGETSLNQIELKILEDVKRKSILHLQFHFGQDPRCRPNPFGWLNSQYQTK